MTHFTLYLAAILYGLCSLAMLGYGLKAYYVVWIFARKAKSVRWLARLRERRFRKRIDEGRVEFPVVTTQIPIYNELNVAERVMRAVAAMDYPIDRHEIQVLDDSNDETADLVDSVAAELKGRGHWIDVVRRSDRSGYKAGALKAGMKLASGEFIAIFDADFVPPIDFLWRCLAQFEDRPRRCLVQARWGHLNRNESMLTKAVALGIDGHFVIEQPARSWNGLFLNFNGTAGLWRREAIEDAGSWRAVTLTEDLELSYRAQLRGWEIFLLDDLVVPAEIPSSYEAFKSQQFRWAKGSIQTAKLLLPRVLKERLPFGVKLHSIFHLTQYSMHLCMLAVSILSIPLLIMLSQISGGIGYWWLLGFIPLLAATIGPSQLYIASQIAQGRSIKKPLVMLPRLMLIGFGICLSNTTAVVQALRGVDSPFVRTPKKGSKPSKAYSVRGNIIPWLETAMGFYTLVSLLLAVLLAKFFLAPYLLLYALGFLTVGISSLRERRQASLP